MTLAISVLLTLTVGVLLFTTQRWIGEEIDVDVAEHLRRTANVLGRLHDFASKERARQVWVSGFDARLQALAKINDEESLQFLASRERVRLKCEAVGIIGANGDVLAWAGEGEGSIPGRIRGRLDAEHRIVDFAAGERGLEAVAIPLGDPASRYMVVVSALDDEVLQEYADAIGEEVKLIVGERVLALGKVERSGEMVFRSIDVPVEGDLRLRITADVTEVAPLEKSLRVTAIIGLGGILLGAVLAVMLARMFAGPIVRLAGMTRAVGRGDLTVRANPQGAPELRDLALNFNAMIASLQEKERELEARAAKEIAEMRARAEEQEKVRKMEEQALRQDKMASLGQLAAGIAHEINNPVAFIYSNIETLDEYIEALFRLLDAYEHLREASRSGTVSAEDMAAVERVEEDIRYGFVRKDLPVLARESLEGAERVRQILAELKVFAHSEEREMKPSDLNHGLEATLNVARNELKYKAEIVKELESIPEVVCHPQQINQVFMNLLVNAAQAIREKGTIRIRTHAEDGHVLVEISDTGQGMPPEVKKRLFEPFFTTKPVGEGTGLGLYTAYNIVKKHGGDIRVESEVGKGTTFTVVLPLRPEGKV